MRKLTPQPLALVLHGCFCFLSTLTFFMPFYMCSFFFHNYFLDTFIKHLVLGSVTMVTSTFPYMFSFPWKFLVCFLHLLIASQSFKGATSHFGLLTLHPIFRFTAPNSFYWPRLWLWHRCHLVKFWIVCEKEKVWGWPSTANRSGNTCCVRSPRLTGAQQHPMRQLALLFHL